MAEINDLNITDASNTARFPENQAPSSVNNGARALEGLIARWHKDINGSKVTTGSANAYVLAANQTLSGYYDGLDLTFDANFTNSGAATINVDGLGAKTIKKFHDVDLASGDFEAGGKYRVVYDGTVFQLMSPVANPPATAASPVTTRGDLITTVNGTVETRIAVGSSGTYVRSNGTDPVWAGIANTDVSGLGALALLNSVNASQIDAAAVHQSELKTTAANITSTGATRIVKVQAGGEYAFDSTLKDSVNAGAQFFYFEAKVVNTTFINAMALATTSGGTITARQRYVQASPPYDLGDGQIPLFIFLDVDAGGNVIGSYIAADPPWANNGPTIIRPDFTRGGVGFQRRPKGFEVQMPRKSILGNPVLREQFLDAKRAIDRADPNSFSEVEVTQALKQADMSLLPHATVGADFSGADPEFPLASIVLLDPVSAVMEDLLVLQEDGEDITDLLQSGFVEFGNSAIPGRKSPPGVMPVSVNWKS